MFNPVLPYKFTAREYQRKFLSAMMRGKKRAVLVWHRRSGKDKTALNFTIAQMGQRVGVYYYLFPTYNQGRKILWDGIGKDGMKFLDHFPKWMVAAKLENEMKIRASNGSLFQVIGTDKVDNIVGTNPVGVVFSEYALQDPRAWDLLRPILRENGGWAVFDFTPRGRNHGWDIYQMAKENPEWYCSLLTIDDTKVLTVDDIEAERREGMSEELIQQEYYCSFEGGMLGAYYFGLMENARKEGRVSNVPVDIGRVHTVWDLGMADATSIWFLQFIGQEIHLVDYYENSGEGLTHYAKILQDKGYLYGSHYAPHDIKVRELGTGKSRWEIAQDLGIRFQIVPDIPVMDGIEAARSIIPRCWFDSVKTVRGINCLDNYRKEYDDQRRCWAQRPYHDWTSHGADAFRYLAVVSQAASGRGKMTAAEARKLYEENAPPVGVRL